MRLSHNRSHAGGVLSKALQRASMLYVMAELGQAFAHHALGQELRNEKRNMIGLGRSRIGYLDRDRV